MSNIDLTTAFRLHAAAKEATREATIAESSALDLVVKAAGSKTFSYEGQLYQVRSRYNKELGITLNFICALKTTPADWLQRARDEKVLAEAGIVPYQKQEPVEDVEEPVEPEEQVADQHASIAAQIGAQLDERPATLPSEQRKAVVSTAELFGDAEVTDDMVTLE